MHPGATIEDQLLARAIAIVEHSLPPGLYADGDCPTARFFVAVRGITSWNEATGKQWNVSEQFYVILPLLACFTKARPLRFFHAEDAKSGTLAKYIKVNISGTVDVIVTDEFASYPWAMKRAGMPEDKHETVNHTAKEYVRGEFHTNSVESAFSLLKFIPDSLIESGSVGTDLS
jgi:hypothetical protein